MPPEYFHRYKKGEEHISVLGLGTNIMTCSWQVTT